MGASSDRARLSFVKEASWGVTPATPTLQKLNYVSEDINFAIKSRVSDSKRSDRMTPDIILTSAGTKGGFDFEFQGAMSGSDDILLLAALYAEKWEGFGVSEGMDSGAITGGTIVAGTSTFDVSSIAGLTGSFTVGKHFYLNTATANKGIYKITAVSNPAGVFTVTPAPTTNETFASTVRMIGQTAKNGSFQHSFTIERFLEDVTEGFVYKGMVADTFDLKFASEKAITGGLAFVGKDVVLGETVIGSVYTEPPTTSFMSANFNVSNLKIDGVAVESCLIESVDLNIKNNVDGKSAVGTFGFCRTRVGSFEAGGKISMYFNDSTMYEKFINNTAFSLSFELTDSTNWTYIFTLPKLKLSDDAVFAKGKNTDVMDDAKYVALADNTTGCMIQVDRIALPA